jgi:mRNA-degrading endonuclease RelE of RelBE toxin-antitoxin system
MPRPIATVHITPDFEKRYLRLPKHIQNLATRKNQWFRKDAFDPRLRTHKLKGELSAY